MSVGPDNPKVRAKVAQKKAARRKKQVQVIASAFDSPKKIGKHTFYPLNMQGVMAVRGHPAILNSTPEMVAYVLGYILTIEPSRRMAAAQDPAQLMATACDFWESEIDDAMLPEISPLVQTSQDIILDPDFFFRKGQKSRPSS